MSIRSMTGYARVRKLGETGEARVSVKSVNHRGLDVHFHMPADLEAFEPDLRALVKRHVARGHIQVRLSLVTDRLRPVASLNRPLLEAYMTGYRQVAAEQGLTDQPDLNVALSIPGMFREEATDETGEAIKSLVLAALEEALVALNEFREREGLGIAGDLRTRAAAIRDGVSCMEEIRSRALPAFQQRLADRLEELLKGVALEPQRLAQEAAVLADRSDIGEELARLKIHAAQVEDLLNQGGEVGKKLDFLLQEMNREANTILSKTSGIGEFGLGITDLALAAKAEIEKIREQSLNLE